MALRITGFVLLTALSAGGAFAASEAQEYGAADGRLATSIVLAQTESVIGKDLVSASGERFGRIIDVLADETGRVRAAVVDYGGFLGVGARKIAIAWPDLRFGPGDGAAGVITDLSREKLSQAPEVKAGRPVIAVSAREAGEDGPVQN